VETTKRLRSPAVDYRVLSSMSELSWSTTEPVSLPSTGVSLTPELPDELPMANAIATARIAATASTATSRLSPLPRGRSRSRREGGMSGIGS